MYYWSTTYIVTMYHHCTPRVKVSLKRVVFNRVVFNRVVTPPDREWRHIYFGGGAACACVLITENGSA